MGSGEVRLPFFKKNDKVRWESQAAGISREKQGVVVEVVDENAYPTTMGKKNLGAPRNHESYVVRASVMNGSEAQKRRTKLYWPKAKYLTLISN